MVDRRNGRSGPAGVLAGILLVGCHSTPPPPDHSDLDAADGRAFVRAQALAVKDLAAQVTLSVETAEFSGALDGALVIAPPDRMRLRTTKLMQDVFDLVVTPEGLELYWIPDRVLYRKRLTSAAGAAAPATAPASDGESRALAFLKTLDPGALRASLTSFELPAVDATPRSPWQARAKVERVDRTRKALVVATGLEDGGRLVRTFAGDSLLLESAEVFRADGAPILIAKYADYRPIGATWLPTTTSLEDRRNGATFTMQFSDVALNEGVLPGAFELVLPADVKVRELE